MFQSHESTSLLPCRRFKAHKDYLTRLLLSPDVKSLATCSADHTVRIWKIDPTEDNLEPTPDIPRSEMMARANGSSNSIQQASGYLPQLKKPGTPSSSSTRNGEVSETDSFRGSDLIAKQRPLPCDTVLENHQRWVWDCAFSADSAYLVTVCSDHYARLWELQSAQIIRQYNGHHRGAVCVALNDYSEPR